MDLEGADKKDQVPQIPFSHWTDNTLQDGKYTTASDMELVGLLMSITFKSPSGQDLQEQLTHSDPEQRPCAAGALSHQWFSEP